MTNSQRITQERAARIQSAADRDPRSDSARSGFAARAQSSADKAAHRESSELSGRR
ncbi:hypothetical protein [Nocardia ninae]|uniref:hypothetical protein n=1 Tax=Nocardia ninae TaxID=356145 RepID=UPI00164A02EB|nr:hypothetical protein [Nocardia ninae]